MTKRDVVLAAIHHDNPPYTPYNICFTTQEAERMAAYTGDKNFRNSIGNHIDLWGYDPFTEIKPGYFRDKFGVIWNRTGADKDIGVIDSILIPETDLSLYKFPELNEEKVREGCEYLVSLKKNGTFRIANLGFSLFERAWTLRGMENLLMDMIAEPDFVDALLDKIVEFNMRYIEICLEYDIDGMIFGDDWGQQKGLIMGPKLWRRFIKPQVKKMYDAVHSKGLVVCQHSCGDISEIFGDLADIGLNVYQTFQPEIYDIKWFRENYGDKITPWGGISTQRLLPYASPEEVKAKTREIIGAFGTGGGYIAAPTHDVPFDVPPENIIAMIEVFKEQSGQ